MDTTVNAVSEVSPGLLSKATHALGLGIAIPGNDRVYPISIWEEVIESLGRIADCPAMTIAKAKSLYTYYMLYHYAPAV